MASNLYRAFAPLVNLLPEKVRIQLLYAVKHKRFLRLKHPVTFNEKVNWRKLHDRAPIFSELADKIIVKEYVKGIVPEAKVPGILWCGDKLEELSAFEDLPDNYVIKANHASGTNIIVNDGKHLAKNTLKMLGREWRRTRIDKTFVEWGYSNIPIKFFVEEFLDFSDFVPVDYKFWVFSGRVEFVQVDTDRFISHQRAFFDRDWVKLPFNLTYPDVRGDLNAPKNFKSMIDTAERLASNLDFVRVDLYSNNEDVFFGEITIYPDAGYGKFHPRRYDEIIGKLWSLD
jgi:hypothetical protein